MRRFQPHDPRTPFFSTSSTAFPQGREEANILAEAEYFRQEREAALAEVQHWQNQRLARHQPAYVPSAPPHVDLSIGQLRNTRIEPQHFAQGYSLAAVQPSRQPLYPPPQPPIDSTFLLNQMTSPRLGHPAGLQPPAQYNPALQLPDYASSVQRLRPTELNSLPTAELGAGGGQLKRAAPSVAPYFEDANLPAKFARTMDTPKRERPNFPQKLMEALTLYEHRRNQSWQPSPPAFQWMNDGTSFIVINEDVFFLEILLEEGLCDKYAKYSSFVRKMSRWGFTRSRCGAGQSFHHVLFRKGDLELCHSMKCSEKAGDVTSSDEPEKDVPPKKTPSTKAKCKAKAEDVTTSSEVPKEEKQDLAPSTKSEDDTAEHIPPATPVEQQDLTPSTKPEEDGTAEHVPPATPVEQQDSAPSTKPEEDDTAEHIPPATPVEQQDLVPSTKPEEDETAEHIPSATPVELKKIPPKAVPESSGVESSSDTA